jgi:hypothetical protein
VAATASGVTITGPAGSVNLNSGGFSAVSSTNSVALSSSAVTITGPNGTLTANATGIKTANGGNTLLVSASGITITQAAGGVTGIDSTGFSTTKGNRSLAVSSSQIKLLDTTNSNSIVFDGSRLRVYSVDGSTAYPYVEISNSGVTINQGALSLDLNGVITRINNTNFGGTGTAGGVVGLKCSFDATPNYGCAVMADQFYACTPTATATLYATSLIMTTTTGGWVTLGPGGFAVSGLPSSPPVAGQSRFWYDPTDGNRVKYQP